MGLLFLGAISRFPLNLLRRTQAQKDIVTHERSELAKESGLGHQNKPERIYYKSSFLVTQQLRHSATQIK